MLNAMSSIEAIAEELKILSTERLEVLRATAGALTPAEADDCARAIQHCERIESGW